MQRGREGESTETTHVWTDPALLLVAAGAAAVRVVIVLTQPVKLGTDASDYNRLGMSLASGHGFGSSHFAPGGGPTALRPPLYPLFLGLVYKVFGSHVNMARTIGALLGGVVVALIIGISVLLWDRRLGLVAGGLAAIYPSLIFASTSLMSESIALPLELLGVFAALQGRRDRRARWLVLSGLCLGLALLVRPNLLLLAIPLALLVKHRGTPRADWARSGILLGCAFLVLVPWLVRDRVVMHHWIPLTTQDGYVLSGTYNQTTCDDQRFPAAWRPANFDSRFERLIASDPKANEITLNDRLLHATDQYAINHPSCVVKATFWNSARLFDLGGLNYTRASVTSEYGLPLSYGTAELAGCFLFLALGVAGLADRRTWKAPWLFWAIPILLWVAMVPIEVLPRFRAVLDPFIVELAAIGVLALAGWARRRQGSGDSLPRQTARSGSSTR